MRYATSFGLLSATLLLVGCAAVPRGPVASIRGKYTDPIADNSGGVVVHAIGIREQTGGYIVDLAVEGQREEALFVATVISSAARQRVAAGAPDFLILRDDLWAEPLKARREWPAPTFGSVAYGPLTHEVVRDGDRARFIFSVSARRRRLNSPAYAWIDRSFVRDEVERPGPTYDTALDLDQHTVHAEEHRPKALYVEIARLPIVPQPRDWPRE